MARNLATVLIILAGLALVFVFFQVSAPPNPATTAPASQTVASVAATPKPPHPGSTTEPALSSATAPASVEAVTTTSAPALSPTSLPAASAVPTVDPSIRFRAIGADDVEGARVATLGSADAGSGFKMQVDLSAWGGSLLQSMLSDYTIMVGRPNHYVVQEARINPEILDRKAYIFPLAARRITIDGVGVELAGVKWHLEEPSAYRMTKDGPAVIGPFTRAIYSVRIVDSAGQDVLKITRTYELSKGSFELVAEQEIKNLSTTPHTVIWEQLGQGDMPGDDASYLGDHRQLGLGYFNTTYNPTHQFIYTESPFRTRLAVLEAVSTGSPVWPPAKMVDKTDIVWAAMINRYFTAVIHRPVDLKTTGVNEGLNVEPLDGLFPAIGLFYVGQQKDSAGNDTREAFLTMTTNPTQIAPGSAANFDVSVYNGPRDANVFALPPYPAMNFKELIVYSLGGFCNFCTFQWLAHFLMYLLRFLHGYILFDWALSIMVLVLLIRMILHPITKKSQLNMARLGKQMAAVAPEVEKIKKRYADDATTQNAEIMKLYQEKDINPMNMLGCLPMLLQMPIWIAFSATLYYAIELRHQAAFFGIFQKLTGGHWTFLADLSSPDRLIQFYDTPHVFPFFFLRFDYSSINLIPMLMGVAYYYSQKLTMPPAANEQMQQQQAMMKYMPFMMVFLMYSTPSGLTLYTAATFTAGIIDSIIVRRQIKREEADGTLLKPRPRKQGGFMDKMMKKLAEKQDEINKLGDQGDENGPKKRK